MVGMGYRHRRVSTVTIRTRGRGRAKGHGVSEGEAPPRPADDPYDGWYAELQEELVDIAAVDDTDHRFETWIAIGMVLAAILGALIAWQASVVSDKASEFFDQASQQRAQREQILATIDVQVDHDVRLAREYGDHVHAQYVFERRSNRAKNTEVAELLDRRAQEEQMYARTLSAHFFALFPTVDASGKTTYDREAAEQALIAGSQAADIRPEETFAAALQERSIVVRLVSIAFLSVFALFFLTLAQLLKAPMVRWLFAGTGTAVFLASAALFIVVQGQA